MKAINNQTKKLAGFTIGLSFLLVFGIVFAATAGLIDFEGYANLRPNTIISIESFQIIKPPVAYPDPPPEGELNTMTWIDDQRDGEYIGHPIENEDDHQTLTVLLILDQVHIVNNERFDERYMKFQLINFGESVTLANFNIPNTLPNGLSLELFKIFAPDGSYYETLNDYVLKPKPTNWPGDDDSYLVTQPSFIFRARWDFDAEDVYIGQHRLSFTVDYSV